MNKKYLITLLLLFVVSIGVRQLIDSTLPPPSEPVKPSAELDLQTLQFKGKEEQTTYPFDTNDTRTRILYFGFAKCPDVCPTSLAVLAATLNQLDEQTLSQFRPIFISLDPERDLADDAAQFAHYFHPNIEGAVTSEQEIKPLANYYNVYFKKVELENSRLSYTIDHTSYFYFTAPDGTLIEKVPHTLTPEPVLNAINQIIHPSNQADKETN